MPSLLQIPMLSLLLAGAPCTAPAPVECSGVSESCFVDVVVQLFEGEEGRLGIGFQKHAAVYFLPEEHACFEEWRELVEESREAERAVRVLFRVMGQEVIGLDPGKASG